MRSTVRGRQHGPRGFSLVELVIVIVIIGIIAAIAIPRVGRSASGAGESALKQDLAVMRNAIELFASQHDGDYPASVSAGVGLNADTPEAFVAHLTKFSDVDGVTNDTYDAGNGFVLGPYLRKGIPPCPVAPNRGSTDVAIDTTNTPPAVTAGSEGWVYNPGTGDLIVNSAAPNEAGTTTFDTY